MFFQIGNPISPPLLNTSNATLARTPFTSISPSHLASDCMITPFATRRSCEDGFHVPNLCLTLLNVSEDITFLMAPSSMFAHTLTTSPRGPRKWTLCLNGFVLPILPFSSFAPISNRSMMSDSVLNSNTSGTVLIIPVCSFFCSISPWVVELALNSTALPLFPAPPAKWFRSRPLPLVVCSPRYMSPSKSVSKWLSRLVRIH